MNNKTKFIALSGKKQCGKDTIASMLKKKLEASGMSVEIDYFARPLKEFCITVLGLERELVYGSNDDKNTETHINWGNMPHYLAITRQALVECKDNCPKHDTPMTVREVLQHIGTNVVRRIDNDAWARAPFRTQREVDVVILADCRFPNEKEWTERNGGVTIRVERDTGFEDDHPSETALDDADFQIRYNNNGTLEELEQFVESLINQIV